MHQLPAVGTVSYNGYTFSAYARTSARMELVKNDGATTSTARKFYLTVVDYIQESSGLEVVGTDASIRNTLLQPHKRLEYSGRGFGDPFVVEGFGSTTSGTQPDLKRGPWPTLENWTPLGSPRAAVFTWSVECTLPPCEAADDRGIMAYEYDVAISQDANLVTSIEYSGYLEVAQPVNGNETIHLLRTADEYRSRINIPLLEGFRRESQQCTLNKAKDRLEFTYIDREMTDPLPDNMVEASASYMVKESVLGGGFAEATLTASYVLKPRAPKWLAWRAFNLLITSKTLDIARSGGNLVLSSGATITEDIYGRGVQCSISFKIEYGKRGLSGLLSQTGIFAEDNAGNAATRSQLPGVPSGRKDASYGSWRRSTKAQNHPFMGTQLRHIGGREVIISLCKSQYPSAPNLTTMPEDYATIAPVQEAETLQRPAILKLLERLDSRVSMNTETHTPAYGSQAVIGADGQVDTNAALSISPSSGTSTQTVSTMPPYTEVSYRGTVFTTAQPYPIPELQKIDGTKPFLMGTTTATSSLVNEIGGTPIFMTKWDQTYGLPSNPDKAVTTIPATVASDQRDPRTQSPSAPSTVARSGNGSAFQAASIPGQYNIGNKVKSPLFV